MSFSGSSEVTPRAWTGRGRFLAGWLLVSLGVLLAWGGERRSAVDGAGLAAGPGLVVGVETDADQELRAAPLSLPIDRPDRAGRAARSLAAALCTLGLLLALQARRTAPHGQAGVPRGTPGGGPRGDSRVAHPDGVAGGAAGGAAGGVAGGVIGGVAAGTAGGLAGGLRRGARWLWAAPGVVGIFWLIRPEAAPGDDLSLSGLLLLLSLCLLAAWRD